MVKTILRKKRKFYVIQTNSDGTSSKVLIPVKTLIILGSGGHTMEMLRLIKYLTPDKYSPLVFVIAETDYHSLAKIKLHCNNIFKKTDKIKIDNSNDDQHKALESENELTKLNDKKYSVVKIPRCREVQQPWLTIFKPTTLALYKSFLLLYNERPDMILTNGPGTCIPICLAALVYQILGLFKLPTVVYIESVCRTHSLSLSGKILYIISDLFFVQWQSLKNQYNRAIYIGRMI
ncbi:unnamed protein product [Gordionus sp. m RMFG-2023]